jgi:AcrR family transcriptional regulator
MKKSRLTEEQVAYALRQAEAGTAVEDICRSLGISQATLYNWKKKVRRALVPATPEPSWSVTIMVQQQLGSSGNLPLDFFKTILDVAWDEIAQWLVQSGTAGTDDAGSSPNAAGSSLSPTIDTPQPTGKKPAVARPVKS